MPRGRRQPPQCSRPYELVMAGDLISLRDWCMKSGANEETMRKASVRNRAGIRREDSPIEDFPVPVTILSVGAIYLESELDAWFSNYITWRPGRPRNGAGGQGRMGQDQEVGALAVRADDEP